MQKKKNHASIGQALQLMFISNIEKYAYAYAKYNLNPVALTVVWFLVPDGLVRNMLNSWDFHTKPFP